MKNRFRLCVLILLLLMPPTTLCSGTNFSMVSLFANEHLFSASLFGSRITLGWATPTRQVYATVRQHFPLTTAAVQAEQQIHAKHSPLSGSLVATLSYHSYGVQNSTTSLITAYRGSVTLLGNNVPLRISIGIGLHGKIRWSKHSDALLWNIDPHTSFTLSQGFFDRLFIMIFISSDLFSMREGNLSYWYGCSIGVALTKKVLLVVKPVVRLTDFINESRFVLEREISLSLCFSDSAAQKELGPMMGVWI